MSRIENGWNEPGAQIVRALATVLDTTADYLLGLADDPGLPDAPRYPVPTPELAPIVARVNGLADGERRQIVDIMGRILAFGCAAAPAEPQWLRLGFTRDELVAWLDTLSEEESARLAGAVQEWLSSRQRRVA